MEFPWGFIVNAAVTAATKKRLFDQLVTLVRRRRKILVLGASGVGKTQLVRSLKEDMIDSIPASERTQFSERTKIIFDNLPFFFIDTPGHVHYARAPKRAVQSAIKKRVSAGMEVDAGHA